MLAKIVVAEYGERAEFVEETFSTSELAKKFGIKFYPAVFVNEVLIAKPSDFFGNKVGRYIPWRDPNNQEKFKVDLKRMIDIALADPAALAREGVAPGAAIGPAPVLQIPDFSAPDLNGTAVDSKSLLGRVVVVEFWAEWCPPCRGTLAWLNQVQREQGRQVQVLGIAVESEEPKIRQIVQSLDLAYPNIIGSSEMQKLFGDILSVPTLFVFDRQGRIGEIFYGAPPDLHQQVNRGISAALK